MNEINKKYKQRLYRNGMHHVYLKLSPKVQGIFSFLKALHMELYPNTYARKRPSVILE
jgi:hypothetical protein